MTYLISGKIVGVAHDRGKAVRAAPAEKGVELHQLSAFPFVAHPDAFARVPAARPMEKEKEIAPTAGVLAIQRFDPGLRALQQQRSSSGKFSSRRIRPVGQEGEVQMRIAIREMMNLQRLEQVIDVFRASQDGAERRPCRDCPGAIPPGE